MGRFFSRFTIGFAVGYVLGARAGRERYEQLRRWWSSFAGNPTVQQAADKGREFVSDAGRSLVGELRSRTGGQTVKEVMTPRPQTVKTSSTVAEAARKMRQNDVGAMVVVDDSDRVVGVVTDRDLTVRVIAEGKDPASTRIAEAASRDLTTITPTDSAEQAVRLMREHALRRLPVVEGDRPVGIVSIGDLAVERDRSSALADFSASPPNR